MYTQKAIEEILKKVSKRKISPQGAFHKLRHLSYESLSFAHVDHHRSLRKGLPEVVYAPGKTSNQLVKITKSLSRNGGPLLITRLEEDRFQTLKKHCPKLSYSKAGRLAYLTPFIQYPIQNRKMIAKSNGLQTIQSQLSPREQAIFQLLRKRELPSKCWKEGLSSFMI